MEIYILKILAIYAMIITYKNLKENLQEIIFDVLKIILLPFKIIKILKKMKKKKKYENLDK